MFYFLSYRNQAPIVIAINTNEGSVNWPIVVFCACILFCWNALKTAAKKVVGMSASKSRASGSNKKNIIPVAANSVNAKSARNLAKHKDYSKRKGPSTLEQRRSAKLAADGKVASKKKIKPAGNSRTPMNPAKPVPRWKQKSRKHRKKNISTLAKSSVARVETHTKS